MFEFSNLAMWSANLLVYATLALQLSAIAFIIFTPEWRKFVIKAPLVVMIKWPVFTVLSCIFVLLAWLLSPFLAAYSVLANVTVLPGFLQWFSVLDDDLDGGQRQSNVGYEKGVTGFKLWWQRTCWICRNPAHGFQGVLLGFPTDGHTVLWESKFDPGISAGFLYAAVMQSASGQLWFTYRHNIQIKGDFYLKTWIGWNYLAYDKVHHPLTFQPFLPRKAS